ncbi:MAG: hypothetical protein ACE5I3_12170 [Phycisphaerae bacterium]
MITSKRLRLGALAPICVWMLGSLAVAVAQPPNDDCADAIAIGDGTFFFTNEGATTDGPTHCGLQRDIWFTYTASCTGVVTVRTCDITFDTAIAAYDGAGCVGPRLACGNDNGDEECGYLSSRMSFSIVAGRQYKLRVGGGGYGSNQGSADLIVSSSSYDNYTSPLSVGDGVFPSSNIGATTDGPSPCGELGSDVWFRYDAGCVGSVKVSTCTPARTFDTVLAAYAGTECVGPLRACNDDDLSDPNCGLEGSTIRLPLKWYSRYLIQAGGFAGEQGDAELVIISCVGDFDADGVIGLGDLATLLVDYGMTCAQPCNTDIDGDGDVDLADLAALLYNYGTTCP